MKLPEKGEPLQLGDIADINDNPQVQKALRRLAADAASKPISRLVMWHLAGGIGLGHARADVGGLGQPLRVDARQGFRRASGQLPDGETGRLLFEVEGTDAASEAVAAELRTALEQKMVLGLVAELGIPARPEGPAVACPGADVGERRTGAGLLAATRRARTGFRSASSRCLAEDNGKFDVGQFADGLAEGVLNRLVRVQLSKGVKDKGKMHYSLRIDNASPWFSTAWRQWDRPANRMKRPRFWRESACRRAGV